MRDLRAEWEALFGQQYPRHVDGIPTEAGLPGELESARVAALAAHVDYIQRARVAWRARIFKQAGWEDLADLARKFKALYKAQRAVWAKASGEGLAEWPQGLAAPLQVAGKPKPKAKATQAGFGFDDLIASIEGGW